MASLAGKSPNIRSYTVYIYGSGQPYIYGVYTATLAGKSPNIRSYTMYITGLANPTHVTCLAPVFTERRCMLECKKMEIVCSVCT